MSFDPDFEKLVKLYYRDLYRFGLSLTASEADAADLTQETFYIWANKGHQLQKPASVKAWLFTTLHREFLKICRRRNRFSNESIDERTEELPDMPADCAERVDSQTLLGILGEIGEDFRGRLCSITCKIFLTMRLPRRWPFRSGQCSRESRAPRLSFSSF